MGVMATEEEVRRWVREERATIKAEEQAICTHAVSGTLHNDGRVTCNQCEKLIVVEDWSSHTRLADDERERFEA